jgi:hypothetical protein
MKQTAIEKATAIVEAAHRDGMLYVPPHYFPIKEGFRCTKCLRATMHTQECLPPYGLQLDKPV